MVLRMNLFQKKARYILILIFLLMVPAIVNGLLLLPAVCKVIGEPKDWISFWGSYAGALITGIISFVILYHTIESNRRENDRQRLIDYNKQLVRDIAESVCSLNIIKIVNCYRQDRDARKIMGIDVTRIEAYKLEITNRYNSFVILYPDADDSFLNEYEKTKKEVIKFIDTLVLLQNRYESAYNIHVQADILSQLTGVAIETTQLENAIHKLWLKAQEITKDIAVK